jgi:glycosyltransferase involved in cell wall biosynthesis
MISFLIAAHNEEATISKALDNLMNLPYKDFEVIVGLDNCTDRTEGIVKSYPVKYCLFNSRQGKNEVINKLVQLASGDIIVIHDSDWIFRVNDKESIENLVKLFENKKVGGIAESFPIQYPMAKGFLERGVMFQTKIWIDYLKDNLVSFNKDWMIADKESHPLLVNILRKDLYNTNYTLGDDFERFNYITQSNKHILVTNKLHLPRMMSSGERYSLKGLLRQKERTAIARKQLKKSYRNKRLDSFDFKLYTLRETLMLSRHPKDMFALILVNIIFIIGSIKSKFKRVSTQEGWGLRGR